MTAVSATEKARRRRPVSLRVAVSVLAGIIAIATALAGSAHFAAQDDSTPPAATPTQEELQERRDQAIADGVDQLELTLDEYNDSGIEGTVTLYDLDDETLVAIEIEGGGESHPAHIHEGTCGNSEAEPFETLTTVDETGQSLSLVDTSLDDLINGGDYTVDLHLSPDELGTLIACANIEGTVVPATPDPNATPAETPGPTPTGEGGITETPTPTDVPATETTEPPTEAATTTATETATEAPTEETPVSTPIASGDEGTQDGTGGADAAPESAASLPLSDYSGLGVTGTVSLIALDAGTTKVTIVLEGDAVTGGHIAHLHRGTCDALQDEGTIYLATVGSDGISETTVGRPISSLLNDGWSVNVHLSDDEWDTWLVCGYLGNATGGITGVADDTAGVSGKGGTISRTPASVVTTADGTSGVSGKGGPVTTTTLTQSVGVGSTLLWPGSPIQAIVWSLSAFAIVLAAAGLILWRGARRNGQPTRWYRLGL